MGGRLNITILYVYIQALMEELLRQSFPPEREMM